jgi:hypothetical protein
MIAALRGRQKADERRSKRDLLLAWHTGAFSGAAFAGKLKSFDEYARPAGDQQHLQHAKTIAFFHRLKARGVPVEITRTVN